MKVNLVRWALIPLAVLFLCSLGVTASHAAPTNFTMVLGTSSDDLNVTGGGGQTINVNDRTCSGSTCIFGNGSASGNNGSNVFTSGTYLMTTPTAAALTLTAGTGGIFTVHQVSPISFSYTSFNSADTLTGTLNFLTATNPPAAGDVSLVSLVGTLNITGGSLASAFNASSEPIGVNLAIFNSLNSLLNGTSTVTAQVETGNIATPEPASIFLFGTGLLAFGFLLKKQRRGLSVTEVA